MKKDELMCDNCGIIVIRKELLSRFERLGAGILFEGKSTVYYCPKCAEEARAKFCEDDAMKKRKPKARYWIRTWSPETLEHGSKEITRWQYWKLKVKLWWGNL
jgi:predicted RNA-binding Zn-ribbon protein involved in translation (DUF1610 family)